MLVLNIPVISCAAKASACVFIFIPCCRYSLPGFFLKVFHFESHSCVDSFWMCEDVWRLPVRWCAIAIALLREMPPPGTSFVRCMCPTRPGNPYGNMCLRNCVSSCVFSDLYVRMALYGYSILMVVSTKPFLHLPLTGIGRSFLQCHHQCRGCD